MRDLLRNSTFHLVFGWSMIAFLVINVLVHVFALHQFQNPPESEISIAHLGSFQSGFPFTMYVFGYKGYFFDERWVWLGLVGNFFVAIVVSFAVGLAWVRWQQKRSIG